ncbi:uncharacterized protein LOC127260753 [Andrographis paniculata]|uniref:uncharacterized protein LOC127260753 n=1 Tax=Andrographis paniculata TaxID=175694 RepID=UPI0021E899E0|nr:uncharacterized protein LOC127260753 [Andrographis paniculata]
MGIKRPLEAENFSENTFKQHKQLDCTSNHTLNTEESQVTWEIGSAGEGKSNICELQFYGQLDRADADIADKDMEASAPLSLVTSSSSEEDAGDGNTSFPSYIPEYTDSNEPSRPPKKFEDPFVNWLNCYPRKVVPVGPEHQAVVSPWDPDKSVKEPSCSSGIAEQHLEKKLMGTCIIQMPELNDSTADGIKAGKGRTDCGCMDKLSMRCVQQHIKEARERLRETIGYKNFTELGFYEMGDVVACKWTPGEERIFNKVVFSNPVSQGRKFWKTLRAVFPTRSQRELVSYYFNVFMLHKRAVQNRAYMSKIDSDDDEEEPKVVNGNFHLNGSYLSETDSEDNGDDEEDEPLGAHADFPLNGSYSLGPDADIENPHTLTGEYYLAGEEDLSTVESLDDQELDTSWVDEFWSEPENNSGDKGSSN